MTNKDECAGTYPVQGYTRADGTEVSGYMRTCGAAHNSDNKNDKLQRRADTLYPTMKDDKVKTPDKSLSLGANIQNIKQVRKTNSTDSLSDLIRHPQYIVTHNHFALGIAIDHIDNKHIKQYVIDHYGREAAENLHMSKKDSYLSTDYAKERLIYNNYEEVSSGNLKNYFKEKITQQIGADKLENTKGICFDVDDESSIEMGKVLANNTKFIQQVKNNQKLLEAGKSINSSIQFTDTNFHNAVGLADIRDMHLNKYGALYLLITDVYDFNDEENASDKVQVGRDRQEKGEIIPYFYVYHVIIPKYERLKEKIK